MRPKTKSRPHRDARSRAARKERSLALHRVDLDDDALLEIVQEQIVVMIENYRTGLLWNLFMSCAEIRHGLRRLDFNSPHLADAVTS